MPLFARPTQTPEQVGAAHRHSQGSVTDMGIHLCGENAAMTEQPLYETDVDAGF